MFETMLTRKPTRKVQRCNFGHFPSPAGDCKECGEPAEPGGKRLCINCTIEQGLNPTAVKPKEAEEEKPKE
jgi:hypothetical protein